MVKIKALTKNRQDLSFFEYPDAEAATFENGIIVITALDSPIVTINTNEYVWIELNWPELNNKG